MKTRNTAARTPKSAARSTKPTTTRKPSAVKVRRVKGAALAPPVVANNPFEFTLNEKRIEEIANHLEWYVDRIRLDLGHLVENAGGELKLNAAHDLDFALHALASFYSGATSAAVDLDADKMLDSWRAEDHGDGGNRRPSQTPALPRKPAAAPTVNAQLYAVLIEANGECFLDEVAIPNVTEQGLENLTDVARAYTDPRKGTRAAVVGLKVRIPMPPKSPTYLPLIDLDNPNAAPQVVGVDYEAEQKQLGDRFHAATPEVK